MTTYETFQKTAVWRDLSGRGKLSVSGPDRVAFLHALLTNDVSGLNRYTGRHGMLLTATGKIIADFFYYRLPESILIDADPVQSMNLKPALESFIIMDDVQVDDVSNNFSHFSLEGPKSEMLLGAVLGGDLPAEEMVVTSVTLKGDPCFVVRKNELSASGYEVILPRPLHGTFRDALLEAGHEFGLRELDADTFDVLRVERGIPLYGRDMSEKNNPLEVRIESAYSLDKGCYPGQEVVAKATNIGGVARVLARVRMSSSEAPRAGASVYGDEREIGWVTSAVYSPGLDSAICLAYLKRKQAGVGQRLRIELDGGGSGEGTVVEDFLSGLQEP